MKVFISWKKRQGILLSQTHGGQIFFTLHGVAPNWMNFVVLRKKKERWSRQIRSTPILFSAMLPLWSIPSPSPVTSTDSILKQEQDTTIRVADAVVLRKKMLTNPTMPPPKIKASATIKVERHSVWRTEGIWILAILLVFAKFGKIQGKRSGDNGGQ
jgi:hypothetical protein